MGELNRHETKTVFRSTAETREFTGIAVPFNTQIDVFGDGSYREEFARGSCVLENTKIFYRHGEIIGHVTASRETADGLEITGKIADTTQGRDAMALLDSGSLDRLSVGFRPVEYTTREDGSIVYTKAEIREVSLVPHPAYKQAKITQIREESKTKMPAENNKELNEIRENLDLMNRNIEMLKNHGNTSTGTVLNTRSIGDLAKKLASEDEQALEFYREFTGGVLADSIVQNSWIGDLTKFVAENRQTLNAFGRAVLPTDGAYLEYSYLDSDNMKVGQQLKEGDELEYGKISLTTAVEPVKTYGGWTDFSIQALRKSSVAFFDHALTALVLQYARVTERVFVKTYLDLIKKETNSDNPTIENLQSDDEWVNVITQAALAYQNRGYTLSGLHVSGDIFQILSNLKDSSGSRIMLAHGQGFNNIGSAAPLSLTGILANLPVTAVPNFPEKTAAFYNPLALQTHENAGAPLRLQSEEIINLTQAFSIYGFMAIVTPYPNAVLPINLGAA